MDHILARDETLDLNSTNHYHLSIRHSQDGLSFCILDLDYNKYIYLESIPFKEEYTIMEDYADYINSLLVGNEIFNKQYKSLYFMTVSPKVTLLPSELAKTGNLKNIYEFNQERGELDELHVNSIKSGQHDLSILFIVHNYIATNLLDQHSNVKFFSQSTPFIREALEKSRKDYGKNKVYINVQPTFFDIVVIKSGQLIMYNNFKFYDENEFVYYILNVYKQLLLDPLKDELILSGEISKKSDHYKLLSVYVANRRIDKPNDCFTYSYTFNSIPTYYFINFFNLYNCV